MTLATTSTICKYPFRSAGPQQLRVGLAERMSANGETLVRPDLDRLRELVEELIAQGVTSVAVSFLHAYRNPSHETGSSRTICNANSRCWTCVFLPMSRRKFANMRGTSTVAANAYVLPIMRSYLTRIGDPWPTQGLRASLS